MSVLLIDPREELEAMVQRLASGLEVEVTREAGPGPRLVIFDGGALPEQAELDRIRTEIGPASALLTGDAQVLTEAASRSWAPLVVRGLLFAPLDEDRLTEQLLEARPPETPASGQPEGVLLISAKEPIGSSLREILPSKCSLEVVSSLPAAWRACRARRFAAILVDVRLTHRRTWERIVALQPGVRTLALVQRRHSARRRVTTTLRVGGSLLLPLLEEQVKEALAEVVAPEVRVSEGIRKVPSDISPEQLPEAIAQSLAEDASEGLSEREIDLSSAELHPEALETVCSLVEERAAELGIKVSWTHQIGAEGEEHEAES